MRVRPNPAVPTADSSPSGASKTDEWLRVAEVGISSTLPVRAPRCPEHVAGRLLRVADAHRPYQPGTCLESYSRLHHGHITLDSGRDSVWFGLHPVGCEAAVRADRAQARRRRGAAVDPGERVRPSGDPGQAPGPALNHPRDMYSPVSVLILILSPTLMWAGTLSS